MQKLKVADYDIIYLSYDEPNAEENYADLLTKIPWAKRVHGVEGSDAAHKACANLSETDRFITIDGDNKIRPEFINQEITIVEGADISKSVISWGARNIINGLQYGNGGIKCWPKDVVLSMKTHESADEDNLKAQIEFCWDLNYIQIDKCMSDVYNNYSPLQAWRAGFREGVKMGLVEGHKVENDKFSKKIHWKNLHRLMIWMNIGMDVANGEWAIYGARHGCYMTNLTDWNYINVRDFSWLNNFWEDYEQTIFHRPQLISEIDRLGNEIKFGLNLPIDKPFTSDQSKFFKMTYTNPSRMKSNLIIE
jgi:hypothetical protein